MKFFGALMVLLIAFFLGGSLYYGAVRLFPATPRNPDLSTDEVYKDCSGLYDKDRAAYDKCTEKGDAERDRRKSAANDLAIGDQNRNMIVTTVAIVILALLALRIFKKYPYLGTSLIIAGTGFFLQYSADNVYNGYTSRTTTLSQTTFNAAYSSRALSMFIVAIVLIVIDIVIVEQAGKKKR